MRVTISPRARRQLEELVCRTRAKSSSTNTEVENALDAALSLLRKYPYFGREYEPCPPYRSYLMREISHWLYYIVNEERRVIEVDAIWSTQRGEGPDLG